MLTARLRAAAPYLLYAAIVAWYCAPLFASPDGVGVYDWDQHLFYYGVVLKNIVEYGQWPFWNPWYCGGNVMWQNPQVALLSPAYPLTAILSLQLAMKVNIVLHYWIGFVGMHVLLTRVISKPGENRLCLDLGHKAVAAENPHPRVKFLNLIGAEAVMQSEEHLVVETVRAGEFAVGDALYGIPRHICPTVALHSFVTTVNGDGLAGARWKVTARERQLTV